MKCLQYKKILDRKYFVRYRTCTYVDKGLIFTYNKHNEISDHQVIAINMNVVLPPQKTVYSRKKPRTQGAFQICITVIIGVE